MLLKYTSPQFKDSKLLLSAIDEYNQIESTIEKEKYRDILMYTISAITKTYLVYATIFVVILVFSLIFKRKKVVTLRKE